MPAAAEIDYLLEHLNRYVHAPVGRSDIRAAFAGLRPLVNHSAVATTAKLSREHTIETSTTGLITVTGGNGLLIGAWRRTSLMPPARAERCRRARA